MKPGIKTTYGYETLTCPIPGCTEDVWLGLIGMVDLTPEIDEIDEPLMEWSSATHWQVECAAGHITATSRDQCDCDSGHAFSVVAFIAGDRQPRCPIGQEG